MKREEATKILKMNSQEIWRAGITMEEEKEAFNMAIEALKEERPHGEWLIVQSNVSKANCGHCGMPSIVEPFGCPPYCQWCGARMKGGDEE